MKSPERLDLAKRFLYVGSMHGEVPMMFAIVAVGAIASTLELRMPCAAMLAPAAAAQSSAPPRGTSICLAALALQQVDRVLRQQPTVPLGAGVRRVRPALGGQVADDASYA